MRGSDTIFVADTCIGGLSVIRSLRDSGRTDDVHFLADYAVNPLGVKDDNAIANVVRRWLALAAQRSDRLMIACNTLSIRYRQMQDALGMATGLRQVVSMVDCFEAMTRQQADRLAGKRVVILGTAFTASQLLYTDLLRAVVADARVSTVTATELERRVARFEPGRANPAASLSVEARESLANAEVVVLACTCFPLIQADLQRLYPGVSFLDPGAYCGELLAADTAARNSALHVEVTGNVVSTERVVDFAASYVGGAGDAS